MRGFAFRHMLYLVNGARDEASDVLARSKHVWEGVREGGSCLHCREGNLADVVLHAETKDATHLVHGHTPASKNHNSCRKRITNYCTVLFCHAGTVVLQCLCMIVLGKAHHRKRRKGGVWAGMDGKPHSLLTAQACTHQYIYGTCKRLFCTCAAAYDMVLHMPYTANKQTEGFILHRLLLVDQLSYRYALSIAAASIHTPLNAHNVAVEGATHILKVTEDECLVDVKAACNNVLCVLHVHNH